MKNTLFVLVLMSLIACKQTSDEKEETNQVKATAQVAKIYPENISKVFKAHGGIDAWNSMNSLEFTIPKENGNEVTTTDLKNRKSLMDMPNHRIGFDGEHVWLKNNDTTNYKGNPKFYYNLMFYFYAMPFVLSDEGINYADVDALEFEDVSYPGVKIAYESGVGESSEDEYILYYNPETFKMEWLGYTVTYFSKEKSTQFNFINYSDLQNVNGLSLPKTLTWYKSENNKPTEKRNAITFTNIKLLKEKLNATLFEMPKGAKVID